MSSTSRLQRLAPYATMRSYVSWWVVVLAGCVGAGCPGPTGSSPQTSPPTPPPLRLESLVGTYSLRLEARDSTCDSTRSPSTRTISSEREATPAPSSQTSPSTARLRITLADESSASDSHAIASTPAARRSTASSLPERTLEVAFCPERCSTESPSTFRFERVDRRTWRGDVAWASVASERLWIRTCRFERLEMELVVERETIRVARMRRVGDVTLEGRGTCRASRAPHFAERLDCRQHTVWRGPRSPTDDGSSSNEATSSAGSRPVRRNPDGQRNVAHPKRGN